MTIPAGPYPDLAFPPPPEGRPYVLCNMVATIDGKTVTGGREDTVMDLGSPVDHAAMRQIEAAVDAVLIGAQTLRATPKVRYDANLYRIVLSRTGDLDFGVRFFTDAPARAIVATPAGVEIGLDEGSHHIVFSSLAELLSRLRRDFGIEHLLAEGGSELNAGLLAEDLVDELFLTVAPKVRLGRTLPTYAGGEPLPKGTLLGFRLVSVHAIEDEVFLRYRRIRT